MSKKQLIDKTGNQINVIYPYRTKHGGWSFDDEEVGLKGEPFVMGIPEVIDLVVPETENSFIAYFSKDPIPNATLKLVKTTSPYQDDESEGWYEIEGMKGWLCPASQLYLKGYPAEIHVRIQLNRK